LGLLPRKGGRYVDNGLYPAYAPMMLKRSNHIPMSTRIDTT
jgi:hypothetical protein